jgi:hypothetical protein
MRSVVTKHGPSGLYKVRFGVRRISAAQPLIPVLALACPNTLSNFNVPPPPFLRHQGLTPPLIGSMAENAVLFAAFDTTYTYLLPDAMPQPAKLAISGAMAGVGVAFILTPVELVKCKLQVENAVTSRYSGPIDCIRQVW